MVVQEEEREVVVVEVVEEQGEEAGVQAGVDGEAGAEEELCI